MKVFLLVFVASSFAVHLQIVPQPRDYIFSYKDKYLKKFVGGIWLRLNHDGTGVVLEWGHCNVIWTDSLSWRANGNRISIRLSQDSLEHHLVKRRNCLMPLKKDDVFIGALQFANDTARFNVLFNQFYLKHRVPCYN